MLNTIEGQVLVSGTQVRLISIEVDDEVIASYLVDVPEEHRTEVTVTALRIGLQALNMSMDHVLLQNVNEARNQLVHVLNDQTSQMAKNTKHLNEEMQNITKHFVDALRDEYRQYFGSQDGRVSETFKKMQEEMKGQVESLTAQVLKQFDPDGSNSIPEKMKDAINKVWAEQAQAFKNILSKENPDNPLSEMAKENKEWQKALEKEMAGLKNEVTNVLQKIAEEKGAKEERIGTPKDGRNFEAVVHECLAFLSRPFGDILDDCSGTPGRLGTSKEGDHLITINLDDSGQIKSYIAWESKTSSKQIKKESDLLALLDRIAENRAADAVVLVVPSQDVLPTGCGDFQIYNNNRIVCVYDYENVLPMQIAYKYSRAIAKIQKTSLSHGKDDGMSREKLEGYISLIVASLKNLLKTGTSLNTIKKESESIKTSIKSHESSILEIIEQMQNEFSPDLKANEDEDSEASDESVNF